MKDKDTLSFRAEKIDELDQMLLKELEVDARQSKADLAAKLNMSPDTVRRRMQRLVELDVMNIVAIPDRQSLGFPLMTLFVINARPGKARDVADYLREHRSARAIVSVTGRYDIFFSATFRDPQELLLFITEELGTNPDVADLETMTVLRMVKDSWMYLRGEESGLKEARLRALDSHDLRLIREIESEPRASITDLSKNLGLGRLSVSRKLQALFDDNILRVVSVADPMAFGYDVQVAILARIQPGAIVALVDRLLVDKRVNHLAITTGAFQLMISAIFHNSNELSEFVRHYLRSSAEVLHTETLLYMSGAKRRFGLTR
ncbi:MAG: Lrp/AsnC family transcriptional regulator [Dehalococcoidia bacterium]|nr:Lrp/AsnC family transcriptional regulator [Dehalococcoidia bacterium]